MASSQAAVDRCSQLSRFKLEARFVAGHSLASAGPGQDRNTTSFAPQDTPPVEIAQVTALQRPRGRALDRILGELEIDPAGICRAFERSCSSNFVTSPPAPH